MSAAEKIVPPAAHEIEMNLLGALMEQNAAYHAVASILQPKHFADDRHRTIYEAIAHLVEKGDRADPVTVGEALKTQGTLADLGGMNYLARLYASTMGPSEARAYAQTIYDRWLRRQGITLLEDWRQELADTSFSAPSAPERFQAMVADLERLCGPSVAREGPVGLAEIAQSAALMAQAAFQQDESVLGLKTGLAPIDRKIRGLRRSDLLILAGRPSMGKTALAGDIAFNVARQGRRVVFFSLEMSREQLVTRELAKLIGISAHDILSGNTQQADFAKIEQARDELSALPLWVDDRAALTVQEMQAAARQRGAELIVVDYLQKSAGAAPGDRYHNDVARVTAVSSGLKDMAKRLEAPVLALSQLSRAVEAREDKRPFMSDLRESGAVEQEADTIMFLFREHYYLARDKPTRRTKESDEAFNERTAEWNERQNKAKGKAELIVAKQRNGPIGHVMLNFDETFTRFSALEKSDESQEGLEF